MVPFGELQPLTCLFILVKFHGVKKMFHQVNFLKLTMKLNVCITDIDKDKKIAISHKLVKENPYESFEKTSSKGSSTKGKISNIKDLFNLIK